MKLLLRILGALGVVALLGAVGLYVYAGTLPTTWHVSVSRDLAAPPEAIGPLVATPASWSRWMNGPPADAHGTTFTPSGPAAGPGAGQAWEGPGTHGKMEIATVDSAGITYTMVMEDSQTPAHGSIAWTAHGTGTTVTWTDEGDFSGVSLGGIFVGMMEKGLTEHIGLALDELGKVAAKQE